MAWFAEDNEVEDSNDPFEILDPPPPDFDFSFADSLLDFDSIQLWFDADSSADMPPLHDNTAKPTHSDPSIHMTSPTVIPRFDPIEAPQLDQLATLSDTIEEGLGKISLAGGSEKPLGAGDNAAQCQLLVGEGEAESSDSENSSTSSSSSPSSTSSASSCSSDSVGHDDNGNNGSRRPDKKEVISEEELEEGEIRDYEDVRELVTKTEAVDDDDDDEDVENLVSWSDLNDSDEDDDDGPIRSKNEPEVLPPVPQVAVSLEPHHQMLPVGVVTSIMGAKVIVEGVEKHDPLDEGSILWIPESRTPLGLVDEVFGPVRNPYYVVRYNSENEVPTGICLGTLISLVPEFVNSVLNKKDLYKKGYDASGLNDEEVTDELEFSDDEKEAEYKRMQKSTKRGFKYQNPRNKKANGKKVPLNARSMLAMPSPNQGNRPTLPGAGHGHDVTNAKAPPFLLPPTCLNPPTASNGIQTSVFPLQRPQPAPPPYCGPVTNGASWFQQNAWNSHQFPVPEIACQHQFNSCQGSPSTNMFGSVRPPNVFAQPPYAPRPVDQNQMTAGTSSLSHSSPFRPPNCSGEPSFLNSQMQFQGNHDLRPGTFQGNSVVSGQFHPGSSAVQGISHFRGQFYPSSSAGRGRKTPHRDRIRNWRPLN